MNRAAFDINAFWFCAVLLHILGSIVFSVMGLLPLGTLFCLAALWGTYIHLSDKKRQSMFIALAGWLISGGVILTMPISYGSSLLMNLLMLLLVYYVCRQREVTLWKYCAFKKIPAVQGGIILLHTFVFLVIASYINAVSMLFVENRTAASLQGTGDIFLQSVLVFAVLPAITEEILFRGYIFRGIADKNVAVIISAVMFALLHMNFNQMSYAFIMGLLFALLVRSTDNLSVSVLVHLLFNLYNVFTAAFPENPAAVFFQTLNIGGYKLIGASLTDSSGEYSFQLMGIGSVIVILALSAAAVLLWLLKKSNGNIAQSQRTTQENSMQKEGIPWKPDRTFWGSCAACLVIAVSYEFLL